MNFITFKFNSTFIHHSVTTSMFMLVLLLNISELSGQKLLHTNQFSFGIGFARDYNNALFPRFSDRALPEEYDINWQEDPSITGRMLSFSYFFRLQTVPVKLEYFRGDFREQYSDPLMRFANSKFDKLYNSLVLGSYHELFKKAKRHQLIFDGGFNFFKLFSSVATYTIIQDENEEYIPDIASVINKTEYGIGLNIGLQYGFVSRNQKAMIGLKISGFGQLNKHQNFTGWAFLPVVSYKF